jgi:hypothetical protein
VAQGELLGSSTIYETASGEFEDLDLDEPLSKTGEYTIVVNPDAASGNVTLRLASS